MRSRRRGAPSDEEVLDIEVSMTALQGAASDPPSAVSFSLLDTPGPNEAGALLAAAEHCCSTQI